MSTENFFWWVGVTLVVMLLLKIGRRLVKAAVVIALMLTIVLIGSKAFAAEATPWTACGSTVTFVAMQSHGAPDGVAAAVAAAYAEIGPVAGLTIMVESGDNPGTATTAWRWSDPLAGIDYPDGDTSDENSITGVEAREHLHSATAPMSGPALKTLLLRDIGRDMGVPFQATGGHLTKADRAALKASCRAQATSTLSTPAPVVTDGTAATVGPQSAVDVPATATTPASVPVKVTPREKAIGYGGAGIGGIVLMLTLFGGRIRNLVSKTGVKVPSWSGVTRWVKRHLRRPSKAKTE